MVAFERIRGEHRINQSAFCQMLGIPERTFRSWKGRPPPKPRPPVPPRPLPPRRAPVRRGRFDLAVIPPGVELTADTTDLDLFDIPLKLIAAQDPGRRDQDLYEAFHLDVAEDTQRVVSVVQAAVRDRPVAQFVTDQGTPYCSHDARKAYEALGLEHAPTKEGAPTQKATIERSFGTLKPLLANIAALTSTMARAVPALRSTALATTVGKYLLALALDAYRLGSSTRIAQTGAPLDREGVVALVRDWVHRRREDHGSCRVHLARLHEEYRMDGSREEFVRALRRYEFEDVQEAERRLRTAACRCQARICDRYFVGILRNVVAEREDRRCEARQRARERARRKEHDRQFSSEQAALRAHPELAVCRGLRIIAAQWQPDKKALWMGGRGMGLIDLRHGLVALHERDGPSVARDAAEVLWRTWVGEQWRAADGERQRAIREIWDRLVNEHFEKPEKDFTPALAERIINPPPLQSNPRSPP